MYYISLIMRPKLINNNHKRHSSTFGRGGEFDWLNEWANQNKRANQNVLINAKDSQCNTRISMYYLNAF